MLGGRSVVASEQQADALAVPDCGQQDHLPRSPCQGQRCLLALAALATQCGAAESETCHASALLLPCIAYRGYVEREAPMETQANAAWLPFLGCCRRYSKLPKHLPTNGPIPGPLKVTVTAHACPTGRPLKRAPVHMAAALLGPVLQHVSCPRQSACMSPSVLSSGLRSPVALAALHNPDKACLAIACIATHVGQYPYMWHL